MRGAAISAGVAAVSLAIGAALRRSGSIELGPTGPFIAEALERWKTGPNALARTSYDCAECGQTVQAGAAFCSNCGAWPGQSG
jgi:hypothetical protein